jgi:hypothetical protein
VTSGLLFPLHRKRHKRSGQPSGAAIGEKSVRAPALYPKAATVIEAIVPTATQNRRSFILIGGCRLAIDFSLLPEGGRYGEDDYFAPAEAFVLIKSGSPLQPLFLRGIQGPNSMDLHDASKNA